jgi:hypothetical protein
MATALPQSHDAALSGPPSQRQRCPAASSCCSWRRPAAAPRRKAAFLQRRALCQRSWPRREMTVLVGVRCGYGPTGRSCFTILAADAGPPLAIGRDEKHSKIVVEVQVWSTTSRSSWGAHRFREMNGHAGTPLQHLSHESIFDLRLTPEESRYVTDHHIKRQHLDKAQVLPTLRWFHM